MKDVFHKNNLIKYIEKVIKKQNKFHRNARKIHVHMWLQIASIKPTVGNKTRLFPGPFHVSTSSRLNLVGAFRSGYVAACRTALPSATEENDSGGYVAVPCPSKLKQRNSTADWLKF